MFRCVSLRPVVFRPVPLSRGPFRFVACRLSECRCEVLVWCYYAVLCVDMCGGARISMVCVGGVFSMCMLFVIVRGFALMCVFAFAHVHVVVVVYRSEIVCP